MRWVSSKVENVNVFVGVMCFFFIHWTDCWHIWIHKRIIAAQTVLFKCHRCFRLFFHHLNSVFFFFACSILLPSTKEKILLPSPIFAYEIPIRDIFEEITVAFSFDSTIWYLALNICIKMYITKWLNENVCKQNHCFMFETFLSLVCHSIWLLSTVDPFFSSQRKMKSECFDIV